MDHLVVLLRRALRQLDQRPHVVEEIDGELPALLLRERSALVVVVAHVAEIVRHSLVRVTPAGGWLAG